MSATSGSAAKQRWLLPVLVAVLALTVAGGFLAREWYRAPQSGTGGTVAAPEPAALDPEEQPGSPVVRLTPDATAHPLGENVRTLLQTYFDAINARDYERWKTTVSSERVQATSKRQWRSDFDSTRDGSILVYRIESAPDNGLRVLLGFTSTQDISQAPVEFPRECIRWRLALPVVKESGQWRIDDLESGNKQERDEC